MSVTSLNSQNLPVLKVKGLGKEYRLYDSPRDRFKSLLFNSQHYKSHWALRDVSFELRPGQCLGVIGDNGAGKSSLLKLMAGTLQPTVGTVERLGRVTAILELGAGFHPDFSGRNNLRFAGSLIGISPLEMNSLEAEIIAFAELEEAIDRPIKTYSSGMIVRLAFSLVTAVIPNVLIVDEALAVGDQYFQKKCTERIEEFRRSGCTILFCSHSLYHVRQLCDMALWLHKGSVKAYGETEMVLASYETHVRGQGEDGLEKVSLAVSDTLSSEKVEDEVLAQPLSGQISTGIVSVEVEILNNDHPPVLQSSDLVITVTAAMKTDECPNIGIMLERVDGVGVTSVASHAEQAQPIKLDSGQWIMKLTFDDIPLQTGEYLVSAYLFDSRGLVVYDEWHRYKSFKIIKSSLTPGLVRLPHHWN